MNRRIVFNITGKLLKALSVIMLLPMLVSVIYKEACAVSFLTAAIISYVLGLLLTVMTKDCKKDLYAREGFLIVALAWVSASLLGCLPFYLSGEIPSFADAFFEMVSGFTTTGASVVVNVEELSHGILFWRSFSHWIGGMGVLVFVVAFAGNLSDKAIHILRAEMPGPSVGKLVPRAKDTSKVLYLMYIVLTLVQVVLLWCGDMNLFEAVFHSLGTAGTGGFCMKGDGLAGYSPYSQWIITVFMFIFGINFNLYYLIIIKRFKAVLKSTELWAYTGIVVVSVVLVTLNVYSMYPTLGETVRHAAFQVSSIITTTGYSTVDFVDWSSFPKAVLLILMFIGGCAGSTAGGLKVSRAVIIAKMVWREIRRMVHPRSVSTIRFEGKDVDDHTRHSITTYLGAYMLLILATFLVISLDGFDFETNFTTAVTCFNNVGPGLSKVVGPMGSFADYSDFSKVVLSFAMLFGRLEIFPLLIALNPAIWRKR